MAIIKMATFFPILQKTLAVVLIGRVSLKHFLKVQQQMFYGEILILVLLTHTLSGAMALLIRIRILENSLRVIKLFFLLNSTEHVIYHAHKC